MQVLTLHPFGAHAHRQPLAYPPVRQAVGDRIALTDTPDDAQIILLSHVRDLTEQAARLGEFAAQGKRLMLLSEEPLWDSVWGPDPTAPVLALPDGVPVAVCSYATSDVFDFAAFPPFLLTDRAFFTRYSTWFARNRALTADDWLARWQAPRWDVAFVAEFRDEPRFDVRTKDAGYFGLAAWRTRVALACDTAQHKVLRMGWGWNDRPARQDLPDWHLEKYLDLVGQCRIMSAIENTHLAGYVTEKLFDALAIGAIPLYVAGPGHRVHDVAPGAFVNLYGLSEADAATMACSFRPDRAFAATYADTQARLAALFTDPERLHAEYNRMADALVLALAAPQMS